MPLSPNPDRDRPRDHSWQAWKERNPPKGPSSDYDRRDRERERERERDIDRERNRGGYTPTSASASASNEYTRSVPPHMQAINPYAPAGPRAYTFASGAGGGGGSGSGRRSTSPEGSKSRHVSESSASGFRTDSYIPHDIEPGQILSPRESYAPRPTPTTSNNDLPQSPAHGMTPPLPHAPPGPSYASSSSSALEYRPRKPSGSERARSRDQSPARSVSSMGGEMRQREYLSGKEGSVAGALESFSKTMHSTLISTSNHALALNHFTRLTRFPQTDPTSSTFEEAHRRVQTAEKALNDQMAALQASFTDLMRCTITRVGDGAISALEIDGLKQRLRKLEEMSSKPTYPAPMSTTAPPAPAPPIDPPPPPPPPDVDMSNPTQPVTDVQAIGTVEDTAATAGTKGRMKAMLLEIIDRLESVETFKQTFDSRMDDMEMALLVKDANEVEEETIYGWGDLEDQRDPDGRLRGLRGVKRKNRDFEENRNVTNNNTEIIEIDMDEEDDRDAETNGGDMVARKNKGKGSPESLQRQIDRLQNEISEMRAGKSTTAGVIQPPTEDAVKANANDNEGSLVAPADITAIQDQLATLSQQIAALQNQIPAATTASSELTMAASPTDAVTSLRNQTSALQAERQAIIAAQSTEQSGLPIDAAKFEGDVNALREEATRLDSDVKILMADKAARSAVYSQISSGITKLADNIKRCRTDLDEHRSSSQAAKDAHNDEISGMKRETEELKAEIQIIKDERERRTEWDKATKHLMETLVIEVKVLKENLRQLTDGREAFQQSVMQAALDAVKEQTRLGTEDYAKIAKREIQNFVTTYMSKRNSSVQGQGHTDRSTSEPANGTNNGISPSVNPAPIPVPSVPEPYQGGSLFPPPLAPPPPQSNGQSTNPTIANDTGSNFSAGGIAPLPQHFDFNQAYNVTPGGSINPLAFGFPQATMPGQTQAASSALELGNAPNHGNGFQQQ